MNKQQFNKIKETVDYVLNRIDEIENNEDLWCSDGIRLRRYYSGSITPTEYIYDAACNVRHTLNRNSYYYLPNAADYMAAYKQLKAEIKRLGDWYREAEETYYDKVNEIRQNFVDNECYSSIDEVPDEEVDNELAYSNELDDYQALYWVIEDFVGMCM